MIRLSYEVSLVCVVRSYFEAGTSLGAARHSPRRGKLFSSAVPTPSPRGKAVTFSVGCADTFPEGEGSDLFCRVGTLFAFGFKCRSEKFF